jgi:HK97 family phage major capsid protein
VLTYVRQLQTERDSLTQAATGITETAASESRDITDTERSSIETMATRCAVLDDQLRTFGAQLESQRQYATLRASLADADETPEPRRGTGIERRSPELSDGRPWGSLFTESAEFRAYDGHGSTGRVAVPGLFTRAPITSGGIGGLPPVPQTVNIGQPSITTPLLDAVGHITTNQMSVQWLKTGKAFPLAAVVAEAAAKPEADFTLDTETGTLQTYAHGKPITRQALANIPMIQSIVETQLRGGIYAKLEADVLAALTALVGGTDIQEVDPGTDTLGGIRTAIGTVQSNGFPSANSVLLNPADWAVLDVDVMHETVNGPNRQAGFWGLKPVASAAVPVGTQYVGDLNTGVTVFDEGKAAVYMSDSHSDYFVRNILVVLAEIMALAMATQPAALVRVVAPAGP